MIKLSFYKLLKTKNLVLNIACLVLFILNSFTSIQAQDRHYVYAELGGEAGLYSINYDTRLAPNSGPGGSGIRVGVSFFEDIFIAPLQLNYLIGKNGKYLEIGGGTTFWSGVIDFGNGTNGFKVVPSLSVKYRSQPTDGGFSWSFGATSLIPLVPIWAGLGAGYSF